ncbi:poly-beta-1,6-N-acetyl-D-glucosamine biosynthesis protein PgaD [Falsiroseomonas oryziterrae]|uniref:poly-beta-1,6-N-acetyl-D-glucosamine biosynthesis protein PgaD n=1 Tax=Falsiroseomonas oryziterrae TaxID=2911368 RepID=UPI001F032B02|nr:poly-beta-1,6-N-acetyl-D-glucosamine biosynthesis protein PgaD [Roseomonas sp. NPKOSM-4]
MTTMPPEPSFMPPPTGEAPFVAPLILRSGARRRAAMLRDLLLTMLVWCGWLYLLVAAIGVFWLPPFVHELLPVEPPESPRRMIEIVLGCAAVAVLGTVFVAARAMLDRRRFAGADRRRAAPEPTDAQLVAELRAEPIDPAALRAARRIVLHHGAHGVVERADLDPGAPAR